MNRRFKVAVFTSIRSEYGPLRPLLAKFEDDPFFELELLVGGAHLQKEYGHTIDEIINDGFRIAARFPFLTDSLAPLRKSVANLSFQMATWLDSNKPDYFFLVGDRAELLPIATAVLLSSIPICHLSGGETTEGAIDNQVRHAISKMAHLHFVANQDFRNNLRYMGEEDWRICVSGEISLDDVLKIKPIPQKDLFDSLEIPQGSKVVLTTFHPETIDNTINIEFLENLWKILATDQEHFFLFTAANFDSGGSEINSFLKRKEGQNQNFKFIPSLGKINYYSMLHYAELVLGNSSSGIFETQSFQIPAINVGKRQQGRLANPNVLNVPTDPIAIANTILNISSLKPTYHYEGQPNIYGEGNAASKIIDFIKKLSKRNILLKKDNFPHSPANPI